MRKNSDLAQDNCSTNSKNRLVADHSQVTEQSLLCCRLGPQLLERPSATTSGAVLVNFTSFFKIGVMNSTNFTDSRMAVEWWA